MLNFQSTQESYLAYNSLRLKKRKRQIIKPNTIHWSLISLITLYYFTQLTFPNIISFSAIPSSNSVIAGIIVLQAVNALKNEFQNCKRIELSKQPVFDAKVEKIPVFPWSIKDPRIRLRRQIILEKISGELIIPSVHDGPSNDCQVCANNIHFNSLQIDLKKVCLYQIDIFLKK